MLVQSTFQVSAVTLSLACCCVQQESGIVNNLHQYTVSQVRKTRIRGESRIWKIKLGYLGSRHHINIIPISHCYLLLVKHSREHRTGQEGAGHQAASGQSCQAINMLLYFYTCCCKVRMVVVMLEHCWGCFLIIIRFCYFSSVIIRDTVMCACF